MSGGIPKAPKTGLGLRLQGDIFPPSETAGRGQRSRGEASETRGAK